MTGRDFDIIHAYTRRQAIEDGVLVDVSEMAREAGFVYPVALTCGAWAECVRVPAGVGGQDEAGRLWDVLQVLRLAIRGARGTDRVAFAVRVQNADTDELPPLVPLYAVCGPGDDAEPVLTVMLPHED
ncbi:DUF6573 family protein [Tautonia sociabilis]|uniref:Uncharacterized protein n=1 Tax=Tautonia sociabilis TaxID=2080755 RepID=A0A432MC74_9BACT|nr:DUF6573 family protein [Tautonia sociabilis]RUL81696.1 hypothetical protein TsocGM_24770 [Tautonia sociabilis]